MSDLMLAVGIGIIIAILIIGLAMESARTEW